MLRYIAIRHGFGVASEKDMELLSSFRLNTMCCEHGVRWMNFATDLVSIAQAMQQPSRLETGGCRYKVHSSYPQVSSSTWSNTFVAS